MHSLVLRVPHFSVLLLLIVFFAGCKATRPIRQILPDEPGGRRINEKGIDAFVTNSDDALATLPFYAADSLVDGKRYTILYLPNPEFDSLAFGIIKSYEPFATSLLSMIKEQGIRGVMVDFRSDPSVPASRSSFSVNENNQEYGGGLAAVSIVFLWDSPSSLRASAFMSELQSSSTVNVRQLENNKMSLAPVNQNRNCFTGNPPGFDN